MMKAYSVFGLLVLVLIIQESLAVPVKRRARQRAKKGGATLDAALSEISSRGSSLKRGSAGRAGTRELWRTADDKFVLTELDIISAIPEEGNKEEPKEGREGKGNVGGNGGGNGGGRGSGRQKRNTITNSARYWPDGKVYYVLLSGFSNAEEAIFNKAVEAFNNYTCVSWIPRTTEASYVLISRDKGCSSQVGYTSWSQPQEMSLAPGCLNGISIPIHEMMHTVGVYHEHTRPDRDTYVTINQANLNATIYQRNFANRSVGDVDLHNTSYDYLSLMHYSRGTFSLNGEDTIVAADSTYQPLMGTSPTFSYKDIQLISTMYSCDKNCPPANCPSGTFQGDGCHCYCETDDDDNPVANCGEVCLWPAQACNCTGRVGACDGVTDSTCSTTSKACECDSGYVSHNGECVLPSSIICTELGVDCKCTLNTNPCSGMPGSFCDAGSESCVCDTGFAQTASAVCTDITTVSCSVLDLSCYCSHKGNLACSSIPQSSCDPASDSCKCDEDFYNNNGLCDAAPACATIGQGCHCSVQGGDACNPIPHTVCNPNTNACDCDAPSWIAQSGVCVDAYLYILDGSPIVTPFQNWVDGNINFASTTGTDTASFNVGSNNLYLNAGGSLTSDIAGILMDPITVSGDWCIAYSANLNNAYVYTEYSYNGVNWGWWGLYSPGNMNYFHDRTEWKIPVSTQLHLRIQATPYSSGTWSAAIDNVRVRKC